MKLHRFPPLLSASYCFHSIVLHCWWNFCFWAVDFLLLFFFFFYLLVICVQFLTYSIGEVLGPSSVSEASSPFCYIISLHFDCCIISLRLLFLFSKSAIFLCIPLHLWLYIGHCIRWFTSLCGIVCSIGHCHSILNPYNCVKSSYSKALDIHRILMYIFWITNSTFVVWLMITLYATASPYA